MLIKQLSVFLENKSGRLTELADILGEAGINMSAMSIADTSEFGIIRIIVSEPDKAFEILKDNHFSVNLTDVICVSIANKAGTLAGALRALSAKNISVEYMYAFSAGTKALVIIRTEDIKNTLEVLKESSVKLIKAREIYQL